MKLIDLTGNKYGRWLVISRASSAPGQQTRWACQCDCGRRRIVAGPRLKSGGSKSCGCFGNERRIETHTTHGRHGTPEYRIWRHLRTRCENPRTPAWPDYGGRGIRVCARWTLFENFFADMGERPSPAHTIDREDVNGDYEPSNCRWATWKQQQRNRRDNLVLQYAGVTAPLSELCEIHGLKYKTVHKRLKDGASLELAMTAGRLPRHSINAGAAA